MMRECAALEIGPARLSGVRSRFERNEEIFGQDECAEHVYLVLSGAVRTVRFSSDGRRQIIAFHLPGDVFGLEFAPRHGFAAEAISEAEILLVRRSALERAAGENGETARALLALAARRMHEAQEHAMVLGLKGAGERLAAFLVGLAARSADHAEFDLPMSRADIADHLALTIETVSRAFTQMERDAAIALPSARHVVLRDWRALEQLQAA
jgi:CRP/FNR family nitrogen fixation transcriptional regulator